MGEGKTLEKATKSNRLTEKEKIRLVTLLGEGYTHAEVVKILSEESKKKITFGQVKHYATSEKWLPKIIEMRKNCYDRSLLIPIAGLDYRMRKYQELYNEEERKKQKNVFLLLQILNAVRIEMSEAQAYLKNKGGDEEDEVIDFVEIVRRLRVSRKTRKDHKAIAKAAGLEW